MQCHKMAARCCNKNVPYSSKLVQVSALQFLSAEFIVYLLFNANCQAHLGEISQRHQHANLAFSIKMLDHTVVGWHVPERYTQSKCALIMH